MFKASLTAVETNRMYQYLKTTERLGKNWILVF